MPNSTLSFASSSSFRDVLMAKNLASYTVTGMYTPPSGPLNYEVVLSQSPVVDSPNDLIANDPFANQLYPLNQFGPDGGYDININFNGPPLPVNSNQGPYSPNSSPLILSNNLYLNLSPFSPAIKNIFIPSSGSFNYVYEVGDSQNNNKLFLPYVLDKTTTPSTFVSSFYTPYEILSSSNPVGNNGPLSNDSFIAKLGAEQLNNLFKERIAAELFQSTIGLVNLESLSDPFEASMIASGKEPLIYRNWRITVPESPIVGVINFATRLSGAYWPVSLIPGDYFEENRQGGLQSQQTSLALNVVNQLTGGFLGPILNVKRNPSQIFLANTGNGQRSVLFKNLEYNRYQPGYQKDFGGILGIVGAIIDLAKSIINPNGTISGGYYVGSTNSEPSNITSPSNAIPVNPYGEQVQTPVYGPSELAILFEGNQNKLNFGLAGKSYTDTGSIDGGLVWTSPKFKPNAGFKATPGGGSGSKDSEFNQISSNYGKAESTGIEFKENSILDNTQRLIDSADNVSGINRLKHVGNAINQVSKVFNDGYKEMTKGSMVLSYKDGTDGSQKGIEYCRVFTKDTPYYTYADLQKTDGITTSGRRFTYSVLDNTYNLNIAPLKGTDSTNIVAGQGPLGTGGYVKKYMFSIENLAWRTSSRPGFTYDDLPVCERGPNGGRIMWFPPYSIQFNDTSSADWQGTTFLGRPEPIYTYKGTSRSGSLSWKIIVDHPSIMNTLIDKQLKGASKERVESIIDSFFAGCVKYDIYELALKFNTLPLSELYTLQEILNDPRKTNLETLNQVVKTIPKDNSANAGNPTSSVETNNQAKEEEVDSSVSDFENKYLDFAFYFENDIPGKNPETTSSVNYESIYESYTDEKNISLYQTNANSAFKKTNVEANTTDFFNNIIKSNFNKFAGGDKNFITDAYDILSKGLGTISVVLEGSASAIASEEYNQKLSERRIDTIRNLFKQKKIGDKSLAEFMEGEKPKLVIKAEKGKGENTIIPKYEVEQGGGGTTATTVNSGTGTDVNCTVSQKPDIVFKGSKTIALINSTSAMACRRVRVKSITVTKIPKQKEEEPQKEVFNPPVSTTGSTSTIPLKKPQPEVTIQQKIREGVSKKVLRHLLTECDYFEMIKESSPMLYDSFKEKIKYFNPAFHSMTPEGLNARLTFLNQCVRPGETIPVISDNKIKSPDAVNTSFGAPPVLILRIGDFYHTKIIPESVAFTYDPLVFDMNPEGIGVQPMIANVTMQFKIIGGMGLKEPVDQLQNALSFNYYANTEIYDERATWTEDTSALDKQIFDAIAAQQPTEKVNNVPEKVNDSASTIGEIKTTVPVTNGENGEMSYMKIMDTMYDNCKSYFENTYNSLLELQKKTNYGMLQLVCTKRNFKKGNVFSKMNYLVTILGKPDYQDNLDKLLTKINEDIMSDNNPIMKEIKLKGFKDPILLSILRNNLTKYVNSLKGTLSTDIATVVNNKMTNQQVDMVQTIRKLNFVNTSSDGLILDSGSVKIYNLTTNLINNVQTDYFKVVTGLNNYNDLLTREKIIPPEYPDTGSFMSQTDLGTVENKRFFTLMGRIFCDKNKVNDFIKTVMTPNLLTYKKPKNLKRVFENIVEDIADDYSKEVKKEDNFFEKFKKSSDYSKYVSGVDAVLFKKGLPRIVNFTTVPNQATQATQETDLKNLYKGDPGKINDLSTFDGKIKFN